jgi:hypothetical protein
VTPPLAAVPDLERELDALYELPLEEFTQARNSLASRLKKAHQADVAAEIRALKKPSAVAWTANSLARSDAKLIGELLAAGDRLRETQQRSLRGAASAEEVGEASAAERGAVQALLAAARKRHGARATPALLNRLGQTLRAAAVDDEGRLLLERGRLTDELKAVGFGPLEAVKPPRRRGDEVARAARERVSMLRAEARHLAAEAHEADIAAAQAERAHAMLVDEAEQKRAAADHAAAELAEAEDALRTRR